MPDDSDSELSALQAILQANQQKSFVQRILNPKAYPVLYNDDGSVSTHKMAWTTASDGKNYVYPTILLGPDGLTAYDPKQAWNLARQSGQYIAFDDPNQADWFSRNYKRVWDQ